LSKRLSLGAALVACVPLALSAVASGAAARTVNVSLTGGSTWTGDFGSASAFALQGTFADAGGTGNRLHSGSYSGTLTAGAYGAPDSCPDFSPNSFNAAPVTGTIDLVMKNGTITTEVEPGGMLCNSFLGAHIQDSAFFLTLRVTGGTKAYAGAAGTLSLRYDSELTFFTGNPDGPPQDSGTLTGTIVR
jgi:hypothetical protein